MTETPPRRGVRSPHRADTREAARAPSRSPPRRPTPADRRPSSASGRRVQADTSSAEERCLSRQGSTRTFAAACAASRESRSPRRRESECGSARCRGFAALRCGSEKTGPWDRPHRCEVLEECLVEGRHERYDALAGVALSVGRVVRGRRARRGTRPRACETVGGGRRRYRPLRRRRRWRDRVCGHAAGGLIALARPRCFVSPDLGRSGTGSAGERADRLGAVRAEVRRVARWVRVHAVSRSLCRSRC
jgi:hypothetical protein